MRVLVTGASGLIGTALVDALKREGHQPVAMVRRPPRGSEEVQWNPAAVDASPFENAGAVVHLAGENIAAGRWTAERKNQILNSRLDGTRNLAQSIASAVHGPKILVSASAVGFYGDRGDEVLTETSAPGSGFLSDVALGWESATKPATRAGVRVVLLRIGVVLARQGGALPKMAVPFRFGVGGRVGTGKQWMSWIDLDDLVRLIVFVISHDNVYGVLNAVAPQSVTNAEFTRTLAHALHRPAIFPVPAFALRLLLGQMADELLLASQRVVPKVALESGFRFEYPQLHAALAKVLDTQ